MRRRRWKIKRTMQTVILVAIAAGAVATFQPSTWRDVEDTMRRQIGSVEDLVRPAAQRTASWLDRQTRAVRDRFGGIENGFTAAAEPRHEEPVRIVRGSGTLSGRARVVDGDTLDLGGVRIRLHGIDAPESAQGCRARGRGWSCGREATRALAGRIGGQPVACEERDRGPLRPGRRGVQHRRIGSQRLDGLRGVGFRLPAVLTCLRGGGVACAGCETRGLARRSRGAVGVAQGQATGGRPIGYATGDRAVQDQGQHQQERHAHFPRPGRSVLRADADHYVEGRAVVLHRERGAGGRMATFETIAPVAADGRAMSAASNARCSDMMAESEAAPLGRYRTIPGAPKKSYDGLRASALGTRYLACRQRARTM